MDLLKGYKDHVYGIHAVIELLNSGKDVGAVYISRNARGPLMTDLRKLLKEKNVPSKDLPPQAFNSIRNINHQGVIAVLSPITYHNLEWMVPKIFESGKQPFFMILDGITDVRNFGAITRSALSFGVDAIIIPFKGSAQVNEFAVKASAGALFHLPICRVKSLNAAIEFLKSSGIKVMGCSEHGKEAYHDAEFNVPLTIVMGAEDRGISPSLIEYLDGVLRIPMTGEIGSLNVSVASGIITSEVYKQRMHASD